MFGYIVMASAEKIPPLGGWDFFLRRRCILQLFYMVVVRICLTFWILYSTQMDTAPRRFHLVSFVVRVSSIISHCNEKFRVVVFVCHHVSVWEVDLRIL